MSENSRPHPKNVPGPFYVADGCCLACGIPEGEAPDLFTFEANHCYVKKQPCTDAEINRMLQAIWGSEMGCIRYRGNDPAMFERFGAMGELELCDFAPSTGVPVILRNHVAFVSIDGRAITPKEVVEDFRSYWIRQKTNKFRGPWRTLLSRRMWFEFAWYEHRYHGVCVSNVDRDRRRIIMSHSPKETLASRGISSALNAWLAQSSRFGRQQWYTAKEWAQRIDGSPAPW
jgi:hypothetical protein